MKLLMNIVYSISMKREREERRERGEREERNKEKQR